MGSEGRRLICVVGATGNQGGSVARRFLAAGFRVRGLTRNSTSPAAKELAAQGAELVEANLDDPSSLHQAFAGANVIFSVTDYWEPFFHPQCRKAAEAQGISYRRFAYDTEYRHGKNIADAAAKVAGSLDANGFLVSTLSHAGKCSNGKFKELYHFDSKADIFPTYVEEHYPELAAKMSCIQTGFFYTSFNILPHSYFGRLPDGRIEMAFATDPTKAVPHFAPVDDMGPFTYAVWQMPPGKHYMAAGTNCTWPEFIKTWSKVSGVPATYRQISPEEMIKATGEPQLGAEVTDMFLYSSQPGYDGGMDVLQAEDIRKAGIDCPMTTWEEWAKRQDWVAILSRLHGTAQ
ncbi:NAD(P)-binding protein [Trichoderma pleuroticola]